MNPEANKALVFELADALLRSWWTVVAGVSFGLAAAVIALQHIPAVYQATAKVLIAPQSVPQEFFQTTVTEDMTRRMMALEEAVISDRYMVQLIDQTYGRPETEEELNALIRSVRRRVSVRPTADLKLGLLSFELSFQDPRPFRAAKVVNTLAELYIEQNTDFRTRQATETLRTVEERLAQAKLDFEDVDRRLNEFNARHSFESESHLDANLRLLENAKRDLENNDGTLAVNAERLRDLRAQLTAASAVATSAELVAQLEQELEDLLLVYSQQHPAVVRKQRQLEDARAAVAAEEVSTQPAAPNDPQVLALQQQISTLELERTTLTSNADRLRRLIREYERRIQAVPEVQPQLTALINEHNILRQRYQDLQEKADIARESQFLEESRKGTRMELAERAEAPGSPIFPDRKKFFALGVAVGLTLFVGPLLLLRLLNPPISSEAGLRALTTLPVLVAIPRIPTPNNRGLGMKRFAKNVALSAVCAAILLAVKAFF